LPHRQGNKKLYLWVVFNHYSFFIGKQKVILFPKYKENGWESAASALIIGSVFLNVDPTHPMVDFKKKKKVVKTFPIASL
jgi:hypothetical protein